MSVSPTAVSGLDPPRLGYQPFQVRAFSEEISSPSMGRVFPLAINHLTNSLARLYVTLAVAAFLDVMAFTPVQVIWPF